jgi:hypothetical protein
VRRGRSTRGLRRALLVLLSVGLVGGSAAGIHAAFSNSTSNPTSSFSAKRIFPGERSTSTWVMTDSATGTAVSRTNDVAFEDGDFYTTGNWSTAFAPNRYVEFELNSPLPDGIPVTGTSFTFRFADDQTNAGNAWCFHFEVRKTSDASVVSTHGSSGAPLACEAVGTLTTVTTPIPAITTSQAANGLTIRVYGSHSGGRAARIDAAVVTGTAYSPFTLYPNHFVDSATGTAATVPWEPGVADGTVYVTNNLTALYVPNRYLEFTFPAYLPSGASVTNASFEFRYRSNTNATSCYYFEVYSGATLLATHGSILGDVDCNTNAALKTVSTPIPSVNTAARANSLIVKLYAKNSGGRGVQVDNVAFKSTYSFD